MVEKLWPFETRRKLYFCQKVIFIFATPNTIFVIFRDFISIFGRPYFEYAFDTPRQLGIHSIARGMGFQMHILTASNSPRCNFYDAPNVGGQNNNVAKIKLLFSKVIFIFFLYYSYQHINQFSPNLHEGFFFRCPP